MSASLLAGVDFAQSLAYHTDRRLQLESLRASVFFLAVWWLLTQIYPYHYLEVKQVRSPRIDILLGRNLLLILWGLILSLPSASEPTRETMQKTAAGQGGTS